MFSRANPFEESVNAATNENLTVENWELILAVTDKLSRATSESARDCISAIEKRLNNRNPNVQLYAVALTEALVKNCDITVHREISSRSFTNTLTRLVHDRTIHSKVRTRILEFIQMCSFEFRADSTLGLMNEVYQSLRAEGIQFPSPQKPKKEFTQSELDKQKEEEEFQLALALSLSESENRPTHKAATPASTTTNTNTTTAKSNNEEESTPKISRVRALYDFQPTEQGELGFQKGDIIRVIESVYRDWWKGELRGKTGIFPVNYVEKIVDPSPSDLLKEAAMEEDVLNETRNIDRLLDMLSNPDPRVRDSFSDNDELQNLYNSSLSIRPKLIKLIEKYSLKKDELVALNEKFMQARTMYDGMLSNSIAKYSSAPTGPYNGYPTSTSTPTTSYNYDTQQQQQQQQQQQPYGNYGYPSNPPSSYAPTQTQQQQPYGYQQQSPAPTQSTPVQQHQQQQPPQQQNSFGYGSDAATPQQQQQQQPYDYNAQYQQPTTQQPQNTVSSDYTSTQAYTSAPPTTTTQEGVYSPQQQQQQQQPYSAYPPANTTEGYAPYTPQVANQQQQYPPYAGQPQQQQQTYPSY